MHILPFSNHDTEAIVALITSIQIDEFGVETSAEDQPDLRTIPEYYQHGAGNFWLAFEGDELVGTIALLDTGNGLCSLRKMFVKKAYRGKKYHVGASLMQTLLDWARERVVQAVYLGTVDVYHAAHRFYEKNGFVEIPGTQLPQQIPVMDVDVKFYRYTF
ncbi:GNAT family N-acetyltransferase [Pseudodesulfovibrio sp. JC047]|uniref:GNAT family N-acetyltransferase n=1 Tax=Pseudodesulfovibrio sp. JC047 TaxID=2683199 RepID=UPI0013D036F0|nr:GNAT family N-acetyltransferase [Pseudodesulfovibrio sp. JC047]NDV19567.1 GNAT family N-acetyltransferase [Pseudodesulfovibrio sp. JC047]